MGMRTGEIVSVVKSSFSLLDKKTRRKFIFVSVFQILLSLLDLVSVALVGLIASLAIRGVQSQQPGDRTERVLQLIHADTISLQGQVMILAFIALTLLVGKTLVSVLVTKRTLKFLANRGADLARNLISNVLQLPINELQQVGLHKLQYSFGAGITGVTLGVMGISTTIIADLSLLLVLGIGLFYLSTSVAIISFIFFGGIALFLHFAIRNHARKVGQTILNSEISTNQKIFEAFSIYREIFVRSKRHHYASQISQHRAVTAIAQADQIFLPNLSKYVIEIALVVGATLIAGIQFLTQPATTAMASLGLFLMAGSRIAPALLRIQQSFIQIETNIDSVSSTLEILNKYSESIHKHEGNFIDEHIDFIYEGFTPTLQANNLTFNFGNNGFHFKPTNLRIESGEFIAVVGPSGSGKTSFVNALLGLLDLSSGSVLISGVPPKIAIQKWPGSIAYVPQDINVANATIAENIELGMGLQETNEEALDYAIKSSELLEVVHSLENGLNTEIGEAGQQLSGGQRQRLGLARALYTRPQLLILDEATSALDSETERLISEALLALRGTVTVVVIAHRLSTVRNADRVLYVKNGEIVCDGPFQKVRSEVPDFDNQAKLMGL
jgi:ABC-type multidrug transport system fused ATPase/permease subunit